MVRYFNDNFTELCFSVSVVLGAEGEESGRGTEEVPVGAETPGAHHWSRRSH